MKWDYLLNSLQNPEKKVVTERVLENTYQKDLPLATKDRYSLVLVRTIIPNLDWSKKEIIEKDFKFQHVVSDFLAVNGIVAAETWLVTIAEELKNEIDSANIDPRDIISLYFEPGEAGEKWSTIHLRYWGPKPG